MTSSSPKQQGRRPARNQLQWSSIRGLFYNAHSYYISCNICLDQGISAEHTAVCPVDDIGITAIQAELAKELSDDVDADYKRISKCIRDEMKATQRRHERLPASQQS